MKIRIREHIISHGVKNPEYEIDGLIADRKGIHSEKGVTAAFVKAKAQGCKAIVIDLDMHMAQREVDIFKLTTKLLHRKVDFISGVIKDCYIILKGNAARITAAQMSIEQITQIVEKITKP